MSEFVCIAPDVKLGKESVAFKESRDARSNGNALENYK